MTSARLAYALGALALAALWVWAALSLWHTSVPSDLNPPALDPGSFFTDAQLDRAGDYEALLRIVALAAILAQLVALGLFARIGVRWVRESAAGRIGTGMLLGMLGLGFVWLAQLPFGLVALWWERRYGVSFQSYGSWVVEDFLSVAPEFLFISLALLVVMAFAGVWRRFWWIAAVPVLVGISLLFAFLQPYVTPDLHSLDRPAVAADARQIAAKEGVSGTSVDVQDVHGLTSAPNAEAMGIGSSRRVVVWDTLLDHFPRDDIRVVLAHEFGHLAKGHVWKALAWAGLLAIPIALLVGWATRRRGGMYEPAAVPLALFVVALLVFMVSPIQNAFTRRHEAEADWVALQTTHDPAAAVDVFKRFTTVALSEPDPPGWAHALFDDHPTVMQRIEMSEAWRERYAP